MSSTVDQRTNSIWDTPGLNERLRELVKDVFSSKRIADMLSEEFSLRINRNMVIGRSRRIGASERVGPPKRAAPDPRRKRNDSPRRHKPIEAAPARIPGAPVEGLPTDCKWPLNDGRPVWLFCGAARQDSMPYCTDHCRMAYNRVRA
jgi:hypothetical protein